LEEIRGGGVHVSRKTRNVQIKRLLSVGRVGEGGNEEKIIKAKQGVGECSLVGGAKNTNLRSKPWEMGSFLEKGGGD